MREDEYLVILAIRCFGIIFAILGIPSTIYCFQNYEAVTITNWIASIILSIGGVACIVFSVVRLLGDNEEE
ncbi:MAG: hypothetical protein HFJ59_04295 [Clostridia bacterium]|nr:hypothetical protein [Clostridia bacterium]